MQHEIRGNLAHFLRLTFERGESCWAGKGAIMSYDDGVSWRLKLPGGVSGAARRMLSGEGLSLARLESARAGAAAAFASNSPGTITLWDLTQGPLVATRGSFLAAWGAVDIDVTIARRPGAALFGGAGLFLQRLSGRGTVAIHASGDLDRRQLARGETLTVSTGHLAAFDDQVDYDIEFVGSLKKALFSGEGAFMTRLRGPGEVLLQTLKRQRELGVRRR